MQYSTMARIARKMQKIVESELTRLHSEAVHRKVERKLGAKKKRGKLVVLNGGKPD